MTGQPTPTIEITIELCGRLADPLGNVLRLRIPERGCTAGRLIGLAQEQHPEMQQALGQVAIKACVNDAIVAPTANLHPGDRIALFPPVSGG